MLYKKIDNNKYFCDIKAYFLLYVKMYNNNIYIQLRKRVYNYTKPFYYIFIIQEDLFLLYIFLYKRNKYCSYTRKCISIIQEDV